MAMNDKFKSNDDMPEDDGTPLGGKIRKLIFPAIENERRPEWQAKMLDKVFASVADNLEMQLEQEFRHFFNHIARQRDPAKHPAIIDALTFARGQQGDAEFEPIKKLQLPISTAFTTFTSEDIKEIPGYIKLHMVARDLDIALKIIGLTIEDAKGGSGLPMPAILVIDTSKSYEDGAAEGGGLYPDLPEKSEAPQKQLPPPKRPGKSHNL